jgi:hypothetical protein
MYFQVMSDLSIILECNETLEEEQRRQRIPVPLVPRGLHKDQLLSLSAHFMTKIRRPAFQAIIRHHGYLHLHTSYLPSTKGASPNSCYWQGVPFVHLFRGIPGNDRKCHPELLWGNTTVLDLLNANLQRIDPHLRACPIFVGNQQMVMLYVFNMYSPGWLAFASRVRGWLKPAPAPAPVAQEPPNVYVPLTSLN